MPILTQPAFGARTALAYITGGALIDVWTLVWYFTREHELTATGQFWVVGLALTGLTLITLGILLGPIGRAARHAELPPKEALQAEADIQRVAAANPAPVAAPAAAVPVAPAVPVATAPAPVAAVPPQPTATMSQPRVS